MTIPCIFCDHKADTLAALKEHSATCPEHPAVKEAANLKRVIAGNNVVYGAECEYTDELNATVKEMEAELAALRAELAQTTAFVSECATDRDDRISGGLKRKAGELLSLLAAVKGDGT